MLASDLIKDYLREDEELERHIILLNKVLKRTRIPKVLYHVTSRVRLPKILKEGLKLNQAPEGGRDIGKGSNYIQRGIYLSDNIDEVLLFTRIHEPATLTIDSHKLKYNKFEFDYEFYYDQIKSLEHNNFTEDEIVDRILMDMKTSYSGFFVVYKDNIPLTAVTNVKGKNLDRSIKFN